MALSSKIQLQIYEMNKMGISPRAISEHLKMDILVVKKCIKQMGVPKKDECTEVSNPQEIYDFLTEKALNISKEEAERRTVIRFKISFSTFNHYYSIWRKNYLDDYSEYSFKEEDFEDFSENEDFEEDDM